MERQEFKQPSLEQVQEAFKNAGNSPEIQILLRTLYGDAVEAEQPDNRPVTDRIKTFEDACRELGEEHPFVKEWLYWQGNCSADLAAYLKLRIICAALNEGWKPKFTEDEWRYYPWFWLYTQDELNNMKEAEKKDRCMRSTGDYQTDYAGFAFANSVNVPSITSAHVGSRLCLKSDTLAVYCGKQFIDIWADFVLTRKDAE